MVLSIGEKLIYATHGHTVNKENPLPFLKGGYLLYGHTHVPAQEQCKDFTYLNPGSISIPKEGSGHSYMILTEDEIRFETVE
jgi:hypothetical protein